MSKTRKGSSLTKKSKCAKVATKKRVGVGKRKTAKLGKVQCGGGQGWRKVSRGVRGAMRTTRSGVRKLGRSTPSSSALLKPFEKAKLNTYIHLKEQKIKDIQEKIEEREEERGEMETEGEDTQTIEHVLKLYKTELTEKIEELEKLKTQLNNGTAKTETTKKIEERKFKKSEAKSRKKNYENDIDNYIKLINKKQKEMKEYCFGRKYKEEFYKWFEGDDIRGKLQTKHKEFLDELKDDIEKYLGPIDHPPPYEDSNPTATPMPVAATSSVQSAVPVPVPVSLEGRDLDPFPIPSASHNLNLSEGLVQPREVPKAYLSEGLVGSEGKPRTGFKSKSNRAAPTVIDTFSPMHKNSAVAAERLRLEEELRVEKEKQEKAAAAAEAAAANVNGNMIGLKNNPEAEETKAAEANTPLL